jgi:hypothetical protein
MSRDNAIDIRDVQLARLRRAWRGGTDPPPGKPPTLPRSLSVELADAFDALIEGYVHPLVRPATKKPGQRTSPTMRRCHISALL